MTSTEVLKARASLADLSCDIKPFCKGMSLREYFDVNPFLMAPMAGVSDAAYRLMARAGGAAIAYTEMVSVAGIHYAGSKTWDLVIPNEAEPDIAVQLFGRQPNLFKEAVIAVSERLEDKLALIDINMACPVPKVTKKGEGSALMDDPKLAQDIVKACLSETNLPITVKMRRGRRIGEESCVEFAQALEDAGVSALAVHGRYANQLYQGEASWDCVSRVSNAVSIPVIGSGDITSAEAAYKMYNNCNVAAVMIARGSYGNPWVFKDALKLVSGNTITKRNTTIKIQALRTHIELLAATGAHIARAKSLCAWYVKGFKDASALRRQAMDCQTVTDFLDYCDRIEKLCAV